MAASGPSLWEFTMRSSSVWHSIESGSTSFLSIDQHIPMKWRSGWWVTLTFLHEFLDGNISLSQIMSQFPCSPSPAVISSCVFELQPRCRLLAPMPHKIIWATRTTLSWFFAIPLPTVKPRYNSTHRHLGKNTIQFPWHARVYNHFPSKY